MPDLSCLWKTLQHTPPFGFVFLLHQGSCPGSPVPSEGILQFSLQSVFSPEVGTTTLLFHHSELWWLPICNSHDSALLAQSGCLVADIYLALTPFQANVIMALQVIPYRSGTTLTLMLQTGCGNKKSLPSHTVMREGAWLWSKCLSLMLPAP